MTYTKIDDIIKDVQKLGYKETTRISSKRCAVLVDNNRRVDTLNFLAEKFEVFGATYDKTPRSQSSVGFISLDNGFSIIAKPKNKQGMKSAGVQNEFVLVGHIKDAIMLNEGSPVDIIFDSGSKKKKFVDIVDVVPAGTDTSGRKKADVVLKTSKNKHFSISIKKDNAQYWESSDRYWAKNAKKYIDLAIKNKRAVLTQMSSGHYVISPTLAVKANNQEKKDVVFGSDIHPHGAVITRTFSERDFVYNGKTNALTVRTSSIINNLSEVKGDKDVYFIIRNDKTRNTSGLYRGIRVLAAYANWLSKNTIVVK